jgi:hypothetical protein
VVAYFNNRGIQLIVYLVFEISRWEFHFGESWYRISVGILDLLCQYNNFWIHGYDFDRNAEVHALVQDCIPVCGIPEIAINDLCA